MKIATTENALVLDSGRRLTKVNDHKILKKERQSNLELLRIISMVMIVAHHYSIYGKFGYVTSSITFNRLWTQFISIGGKIGVNIFILITGYFMLTTEINWKKLLKLWLQVVFYSIVCFLLVHAWNKTPIGIIPFIKAVFSIIFSQYWFATSYIGLFLLAPFVNILINNINQKQFMKLLAILLIIWSVIPTLTTGSIGYSDLGWFILIYLIAAYIRKYPNNYFDSLKFNLWASGILILISIVIIIFMDVLGLKYAAFGDYATYFSGLNRMPAVLLSITLFQVFRKIKLPYNRVINYIAGSMFGVYLLHDNRYIRSILWNGIFNNSKFANSSYLWLHSVIVITITFMACTIIDIIRREGIERPLFYFTDKSAK